MRLVQVQKNSINPAVAAQRAAGSLILPAGFKYNA